MLSGTSVQKLQTEYYQGQFTYKIIVKRVKKVLSCKVGKITYFCNPDTGPFETGHRAFWTSSKKRGGQRCSQTF